MFPFGLNASTLASLPAPVLQSLTIPSHTTRVSPPPAHTIYHLTIRTSHATYTLTPRYSSFESLHAALSTELGTPPPGNFPAKHPYRLLLNPFGGRGLSDAETVERREALERWLRGLVMDRDRRWVNSRAMREFLAAPEGLGEEGGEGAAKGGEKRWTSSGWLVEHGEVAALARAARAGFAKRDELMYRDGSAGAYGVDKSAKKGVVEVVTRLGALTRGLKELAEGGMVQGEVTRRSGMIQAIQDEVEGLALVSGNKPRAPLTTGKREAEEQQHESGGQRSALLASKGPSRVLGAQVKGKETAETRPLDNGGLLLLQDEYVKDQDSKLEGLAGALRRQRDLGLMIADELAIQDETIRGLEGDVDRVGGRLKAADKTIRRLG